MATAFDCHTYIKEKEVCVHVTLLLRVYNYRHSINSEIWGCDLYTECYILTCMHWHTTIIIIIHQCDGLSLPPSPSSLPPSLPPSLHCRLNKRGEKQRDQSWSGGERLVIMHRWCAGVHGVQCTGCCMACRFDHKQRWERKSNM